MPELPDITIYLERLRAAVLGEPLAQIRIASPFVLRTVDPPATLFAGRVLSEVDRIGKRIVLGFEGESFAVIHLMIAGRLKWMKPGASIRQKTALCAFDFPDGALVLTEAGSKRRASLHLVQGRDGLAIFERGGVDVLRASPGEFVRALKRENRTLKRALTDPTIVDGVGNAYSDEILHRAKMSPFKKTGDASEADLRRLHEAAAAVLLEWIERLRADTGESFPKKVTAFRPEMAVHGKFGEACPRCGAPVQRIVYAENEANYCPGCQTGGKVFADRSLSRLLKDDWPRTLEELEEWSATRRT